MAVHEELMNPELEYTFSKCILCKPAYLTGLEVKADLLLIQI
jgi:hypothetical protein